MKLHVRANTHVGDARMRILELTFEVGSHSRILSFFVECAEHCALSVSTAMCLLG